MAKNATGEVTQSPARRRSRKARRQKLIRAKRLRMARVILTRTLVSFLTALIFTCAVLLCGIYIVSRGPSQTADDLFVTSVMETSALKFVARIFHSEAEVQEILARNSIVATEEVTDTSLIAIEQPEKKAETPTGKDVEEEPDIAVVDVVKPTYSGKMMIIKDPSRVAVGLCASSFGDGKGKKLAKIVDNYGAIAGVNGGAFYDSYGAGDGGTPDGTVIKDGKILWTRARTENAKALIGLTNDHKLYVSYNLDGKAALENNVRDAVTFGPVLVMNGEPASVRGFSSGMNPRTAIGQRADGAILLLVIDGRKVNSMGATFTDLIDVMLEYGAINAANLDGGSSSYLYYNGEYINSGSSLTGPRSICTAILVF